MPCFSPLDAWQHVEGGEVVFREVANSRALQLPCGQCVGCRLERSRQWAMRCMHESQLHDENSFITLTFSDEHATESLDYRDFQLFMKRLRKKFPNKRIRFYMCGEYGEKFSRPHFHACLFGVGFYEDREVWRQLPSGSNLYRSKALEELWPFGFSSIGDVTFESAAYVARYVMKKMTGPKADEHYEYVDEYGELRQRTPEFTRMSLKPGIGADWIRRYKTDVFRGDGSAEVMVNGKAMKPPRYYDRFLEELDGIELDMVQFGRYKKSLSRREDQSPHRLAAREQVAEAGLKFKKRSLE